MLPSYLQNKLNILGINTVAELKKYHYIKVFQWLKYIIPSISINVLFDLYCLNHDLALKSLNKQQQAIVIQKYKSALISYPPISQITINGYLSEAIAQAHVALHNDDIPIGAVIVKDCNIIAHGYNKTLCNQDITQHAEIIALQSAMQQLGNYRLDDCDLYVTIEPCAMCAGAILQSRIRRLTFGALEPKTGAVCSQYKIFDNLQTNHHTEVIGPIDNPRFSQLLKQFFLNKRINIV